MYDMDEGYWDNKPMAMQLDGIANHIDYPTSSDEISPIDMSGLVSAGVRFPDVEKLFGDNTYTGKVLLNLYSTPL